MAFFSNEQISPVEPELIQSVAANETIYQVEPELIQTLPSNETVLKVKPDLISTGNIGCIMQIANGINIPIVHTVELMDWYTGGPKPKSLDSI